MYRTYLIGFLIDTVSALTYEEATLKFPALKGQTFTYL